MIESTIHAQQKHCDHVSIWPAFWCVVLLLIFLPSVAATNAAVVGKIRSKLSKTIIVNIQFLLRILLLGFGFTAPPRSALQHSH